MVIKFKHPKNFRSMKTFPLAGESKFRPLTVAKVKFVHVSLFVLNSFHWARRAATVCLAVTLSFAAAQDAAPAKAPAPEKPKPADSQLEKLANETEKEAAAASKDQPEKEAKSTDKKPDKNAKAAVADKKDDDQDETTEKTTKKKSKKSREKSTGMFRPDFRDQEIQEILKMFSKIIGKNIIADEKVKGKISVISPYKIPKSLAYPYLYSMLSIKGFGIVEENENLIRVVAVKDALANSQLIYLGRELVNNEGEKTDLPVTQIMPVYGTKASRLSAILKRLTSANTDLIDYDDINMLIITGSTFEVNRLIRVANMIDFKGPEPECDEKKDPECGIIKHDGSVHVYRLENMLAENVEATLKKVQLPVEPIRPPAAAGAPGSAPAPTVSQANIQKKPIDIVAHKETNSVIYVGTNEEFDLVKSLIKRIDLQRQQVLLEVLIVEVGLDKSGSFGLDWLAGKGGTAQFNNGLAAPYIDTTTGTLNTNKVNTTTGFSATFVSDSISGLIGILNVQLGKSNYLVVSAPQVLTLDNQEAEINVGKDQPVRVNSVTSVTSGPLAQSQSFEYRPTGVKLKFTPQVSKNRMVTINLFQEIKDVSSTDASSGNPIISKKDIKTVVRVADGQTIVIGGLVSSNRKNTIAKVPILGEFPLIGFLFRRSTNSYTRSNLLVFITPHVLTNRRIADKVTDDLKNDQIKENLRNDLD
jgi:general secretion pathway protein D